VPIECQTLRRLTALLLIFSLLACQPATPVLKERPVPDLPDIQAKLAFTCAYEKDRIPPRDPEAEQLYKHARWLAKNNILKEDPTVYPSIERLIRIATAYGHDKANLELRQMIGTGQADSDDPVKETLDLTEDLIQRGIPGGYYDMGRYLESGYGVKEDPELALKYYRKAADLGSPEGQYLIGDKLTDKVKMGEEIAKIGWQMYRCAAEQGHGNAAKELGIYLASPGSHPEALIAFQLGVKAGNSGAALSLQDGFGGPEPTDELNYLGQQKDPERVRRYNVIRNFLGNYDYLNPSVPEIDQIVPLPPAKLPPWDGKLQWLEAHKANVPPPLPSEERIAEMARAKGLEPKTGRPLATTPQASPQKPRAAAPVVPLGSQYATGQTCPANGLWTCSVTGQTRAFHVGQTFPEVAQAIERTVWQKFKGSQETALIATTWQLTRNT